LKKKTATAIIGVILAILMTIFYVNQLTQITTLNKEIAGIKKEKVVLEKKLVAKKMSVEQRVDLKKVEEIASSKLDMKIGSEINNIKLK